MEFDGTEYNNTENSAPTERELLIRLLQKIKEHKFDEKFDIDDTIHFLNAKMIKEM